MNSEPIFSKKQTWALIIPLMVGQLLGFRLVRHVRMLPRPVQEREMAFPQNKGMKSLHLATFDFIDSIIPNSLSIADVPCIRETKSPASFLNAMAFSERASPPSPGGTVST